MADKQKLRDMLDSLIDSNSDQAQVDFHQYLEVKMKDVLNPEDAAAADVEAEVDAKDENSESKE